MDRKENSLNERLIMNQLAMDLAYEKVLNSLKTKDNTLIYIALSECLAWIANTIEWHFVDSKGEFNRKLKEIPNGEILLGLRHANNMIKHNFNFIHEHKLVHQTTLPQTIPFYAVAVYCWIEAGDEFEGKYKNQKLSYDNFVAGKGILGVLKIAIQLLNLENEKVLSDKV